MTTLAQISASQSQKEVTANQNFEALSPAGMFARRAAATTGLTWGYYGGYILLDGVQTSIADGAVSLTASKTQYVEGHKRSSTTVNISGISKAAQGVVSTSTNHNRAIGDVIYMVGIAGMTELNGSFATVVAVPSATQLTINVDTSGFATWTSGGTVAACGEEGTTFTVGKTLASNFNAGSYPMYQVVAGASTITSYIDYRLLAQGFTGHISKSVAGSANVVLSAAEARNQSLELTGALTGNISIVFPAQVGMWWIYNNTSGAYTLTLKNPLGTGIVLPQGSKTLVISDGLTTFETPMWLSSLLLGGHLTLADAKNVVFGTTTGTQLGTSTTQKLAMWGATPVVQPANANQAAVTLGNTDGEISALTFSASPTQAECEALRDKAEELADDVRALSTLLHQIRSDLVTIGVIKGAA